MTFESPSAFSIFLKRLVNPARKADDGWKTVKYNGRFLEQFKLELARRRLGMRSEEGNSGTSVPESPAGLHRKNVEEVGKYQISAVHSKMSITDVSQLWFCQTALQTSTVSGVGFCRSRLLIQGRRRGEAPADHNSS